MSNCLFAPSKKHCWHWSQYSHTIYNGQDCTSETFICCWCRMENHSNLCIDAYAASGHGPYSGAGYIPVGPPPDSPNY